MASSATPSVLPYMPTSWTSVTWHRLKHRVFYFICLHLEPLLHDIVCYTECSTLSAYITDHCYMISFAIPSVLLYLPISRTIVICHRLQHRVFYFTCLYHGPVWHDIVCYTECSTLSAYIMDHCYMSLSETPSVLLYLPTSWTSVTWHRLKHRVFYFICLYHGPLVHDIVCYTECSTLSAYVIDYWYILVCNTEFFYLTSSAYVMDYWYSLVSNTELFYLTCLRLGLLIHYRL